MTQTEYSNAIVNTMLGWLKGLANWVLKLFNLSGGFSPLKFLADNWLHILIVLLVFGVAVDLLVWLVRWRPHWVWFRKNRIIIHDKDFFKREKFSVKTKETRTDVRHGQRPKRNWEDNDFVVPSAARQRREALRAAEEQQRRVREAHLRARPSPDVFTDDAFNVNAKQMYSDRFEDEVFSVNNLPKPVRKSTASGARRDAGGARRSTQARGTGASRNAQARVKRRGEG